MDIHTLLGKFGVHVYVIGCFSSKEKAEDAKAEYIEASKTRADLLTFDSFDIEQYELDAI
jgi:hypothetical protein